MLGTCGGMRHWVGWFGGEGRKAELAASLPAVPGTDHDAQPPLFGSEKPLGDLWEGD